MKTKFSLLFLSLLLVVVYFKPAIEKNKSSIFRAVQLESQVAFAQSEGGLGYATVNSYWVTDSVGTALYCDTDCDGFGDLDCVSTCY